MKRGLVIGCGGIVGGAWSIAALSRVEAAVGWQPQDADVMIGTSAGAVLVTLLAAGATPRCLLRAQRDDGFAASYGWHHPTAGGPKTPPFPGIRPGGVRMALSSLVGYGEGGLMTSLAGLLPSGKVAAPAIAGLVHRFTGGADWVEHPATYIATVDYSNGVRVPFGAPHAPPARIDLAVRASCAIPGWAAPVEIGDKLYIDGGTVSPTSADLLAGMGLEEIVVVSPMTSPRRISPTGGLLNWVERSVLRRAMTRKLDREEKILRAEGTRVLRIEPNASELEAMGPNFMDESRRRRTVERATRAL